MTDWSVIVNWKFPGQTGLMPALAMMSRHFGTSSSMRFRMPSGPLPMTSKPLLRNCSATTGIFRISIDLADNSSTMAGEVHRREKALERVGDKILVAEFDHGRHIGQIEPAMDAGDGKHLQVTATCVVPLRMAWMAAPA